MKRVRVLVVDDSAFARKVVREVLSSDAGIEVVDIARDGLEALEKIQELQPDVVSLDLVMPGLDGLGVLAALAAMPRPPRVVVVSTSDAQSELGLKVLEAGAVDLVHKPTALATERLYDMGAELQRKVRAAAAARPRRFAPAPEPAPASARLSAAAPAARLVVIGASTGGPPAVTRLLSALPSDFSVPIAIAVHLPGEYTQAFAQRLDQVSKLHVVVAEDGAKLERGQVVIARGGLHLRITLRAGLLVARLEAEPLASPYRPSVDVLFASAAHAVGRDALAVVLTGMGDDGLAGSRAVKAAGGVVLTESEESCVVYGMPRVVAEAGLSDAQAPIERMAAAIVSRV